MDLSMKQDEQTQGPSTTPTPPPLPIQPTEQVENSTPPEVVASFSRARDQLDLLVEQSKFEKFGLDLITGLLRAERQKIENGNPVETRLEKYQIDAVLKVQDHFNSQRRDEVEDSCPGPHKKALIIAPPGSGKSGMVTLIPYVLQSKKVLILTPSKIISEQLAADFGFPENKTTPFLSKSGMFLESRHYKKLLEPVLVCYTQRDIDEGMTSRNLVIVNAQKFVWKSGSSLSTSKSPEEREKVLKALDEFDTIIVDEAHHYPATTWLNIIEAFEDKNKKVVFLTATPFRGDEHLSKLHTCVETVFEIKNHQLEGKTIRRTEFIDRDAATVTEDVSDPEFLEELAKDIDELLFIRMHRPQNCSNKTRA